MVQKTNSALLSFTEFQNTCMHVDGIDNIIVF